MNREFAWLTHGPGFEHDYIQAVFGEYVRCHAPRRSRTDNRHVIDMGRFENLEQRLCLFTRPQRGTPILRNTMTRMRAALRIEHKRHALVPELINNALFRRIEPFGDGPF
jgi:hypothetical protein